MSGVDAIQSNLAAWANLSECLTRKINNTASNSQEQITSYVRKIIYGKLRNDSYFPLLVIHIRRNGSKRRALSDE